MADVELIDCGTIVQLIPRTQAARDWIAENVQTEGWQWLGRALCVDHRYAGAIAEGMIGDGLALC